MRRSWIKGTSSLMKCSMGVGGDRSHLDGTDESERLYEKYKQSRGGRNAGEYNVSRVNKQTRKHCNPR